MTDAITPLPTKVRAKFFKGETGLDYVEITIVGDPNSVIRKVTPGDVARFAREWAAYAEKNAEIEVSGTPLTEVPGVDVQVATNFRLKGVRTAEELAGLDEAAAKSLGMGGLAFWNAAKMLVKLREMEALQQVVAEAPKRGRRSHDAGAET